MTQHYHVASGLSGYGPDAADSDGFATFDNLSDALEYARDELLTWIDMAHESAHTFAEQGQYKEAWQEIVRCEELELLRANLDPARKDAPLYKDNPTAYEALQREQFAQFPHDVSHNSRLYLWECGEDCETEGDES